MPRLLAGFDLVQNVVAQLFRFIVIDIGYADTSRRHIQPQTRQILAPLVAGLSDGDSLHLTKQQAHGTETE